MTMYINSMLVSGIQHNCPHGTINLGGGGEPPSVQANVIKEILVHINLMI